MKMCDSAVLTYEGMSFRSVLTYRCVMLGLFGVFHSFDHTVCIYAAQ